MRAPLLSATLIVRDEEGHLPDCLASLRGVADEIVVVDTGSADDSVAVARAHGARVIEHEWRDDFAEARNVALDTASGVWTLYVDADERLLSVDAAAVRRRLSTASETAFRVRLRPTTRSTPYLEYRLWRADPAIRFHGVIHEQVVEDIHRVARRDGRPIGDFHELELEHVGYDRDQAAKHRRNLPLLRRQLAASPRNIFNWRHLSRVLAATGDAEGAEEALGRAVELARAESTPSSHGSLAWSDLVRVRHERGVDVTDLLAEGFARWPDNWMLVWVEGHVLLDARRFEEAAERFARLAEVDVSTLPATGVAYDERIFGAWAHSSLALALFRSGRYQEAGAAYDAAARLEPDEPEHAVKRTLAQARARGLTG